MKNNLNKMTVLAVLAIFLTVSIGYALFSDTITITGTAKAEGKFDIEATCQLGALAGADPDQIDLYDEKGYENDKCEVDDDKVTFSVDLLYPGAARHFTVKITNNGTINAMFDPSTLGVKSSEKECIDGYNNTEKNGEIEDSECYDPAADEESNVFFNEMRGLAAIEENGVITYLNSENENSVLGKYIFENDGEMVVNFPPKTSIYIVYVADFQLLNDTDRLGNDFLVKDIFTYEYNFQQSAKQNN